MMNAAESSGVLIGRVESVVSDVVRVVGSGPVQLEGVVQFSSGSKGVVFSFDENSAQVILLERAHAIQKGDTVFLVASSTSVTVGDELLGRVISPLGEPLDGGGVPETKERWPIERPARLLNERKSITASLFTGFISIDSQVPIGKGQRELLIGDRVIDKGGIGAAIIGNQVSDKNVIGIYVGIDMQTTVAKRRIAQFERYGVKEKTVTIVARSSDTPLMNYLAPMAAASIAEFFASSGKDVVIIYDSLTLHAKVYRQLALLLNRPPGREAYPGDVFYLHSRLLERAGSFEESAGGGSITAIPLVDVNGEEITDYITTNLMSITDGHILCSQELANQGIRPAVDSSFSVSRIGGQAQSPAIRLLSDQVRLLLVRYREVERYVSFGQELREDSQKILLNGRILMRLFHQELDELLTPLEETFLLYALVHDYFLKWEVEKISVLRDRILYYLRNNPDEKLDKVILHTSLEEVEPILQKKWEELLAQPFLPEIREEKVGSSAEQETVNDVLKDFAGEEYGPTKGPEGRA